ncbi:S8 family serine peptidase [Paenibacillus elgii]|uniref:S8 family serine peptidase n=1 Tax=Paenibacillus elgii TaxID=189691 RepID=UPI0013CFB6AA|nr:S8 family serine peptidase [Paenibacillus elgii]
MQLYLVRCIKSKKGLYLIIIFSMLLVILLFTTYDVKYYNDVTAQGLSVRNYLGLEKSSFKQSTGRNVTIAIVDSGIELHNDINRNKILKFKDFVNNKEELYDDNGHGTFIAGIINANGKLRGIAPDADLVIIKVIDSKGNTDKDLLEKSLEWLIENKYKYNINVINISLGVPTYTNNDDLSYDEIFEKLKTLRRMGVLTVMSAGNNGPNSGSIVYPASSPDVITVGYINNNGTYSHSDDKVAYSSSKGFEKGNNIKPNLVTLGVDILSLDYRDLGGYLTASGSSYAAAILSGVLAVLIESNRVQPKSDIETILYRYVEKLSDCNEFCQGMGQLNFSTH